MADKTKILAIDPGSKQSALVVWNGSVVEFRDILSNVELLWMLVSHPDLKFGCPMVIEQVRSYGMPVGADIFDTVHWSGRFHQAWINNNGCTEVHLMPRKDVKMHLCQTPRAKDSNVIQALVDRFAYGQKNKGKGTKEEPGFFFGFKADIWQAFALAVTFWDLAISEH